MNAKRSPLTWTACLLLFTGCGLVLEPAPEFPCGARLQAGAALSESAAPGLGPAWTDGESTFEVRWAPSPRHVEVWKTSPVGGTERVASAVLTTQAPLFSCSPAIETAHGWSWAMCSAAECLLLEYRNGAIVTSLSIPVSGAYPRIFRWDDVTVLDTEGYVVVIKGEGTPLVRPLGSHARVWMARGEVTFARGNSLCRLSLSSGAERCQAWLGKIQSGMSWGHTEVIASRDVLRRQRVDVLDHDGRRLHSWSWPHGQMMMIAGRSRGFAWRPGDTTIYAIEPDRVRSVQVGVPVDWIAEVTSATTVRVRSGARLLDLELDWD